MEVQVVYAEFVPTIEKCMNKNAVRAPSLVSQSSDPRPLETLTLEKAIEVVKGAGYKVIKEM